MSGINILWLFGGIIFALYIFNRLTKGITRSASCLVGKTALITGANSGLGYQTALNLASRGCKIIMADVANMEESRQKIIAYTSNSNIITQKLDLSSLKSVRDFAAEIKRTEGKLDILINNAGIGASEDNRTNDGLHPVMQINYLSHFLLTHLLIDLLKKSGAGRIVFTSSLLAFTNNLSGDNLNFNLKSSNLANFWRQMIIYGNSKLAIIVASDIFAQKLQGTGITSNCVHPGLVTTPIFKHSYAVIQDTFYRTFAEFCHKFFAKDPWEGSQTLVHAAVSKQLEHSTGKFFSDCKPFFKPWAAYNQRWCQKIWETSERLVDLKPHEKL